MEVGDFDNLDFINDFGKGSFFSEVEQKLVCYGLKNLGR